MPPYRAYADAGYRHHESNPSRLSGNERIKARLAAFRARSVRKTHVTIASLIDNLAADRETALKLGQASAAIAATALTARLLGFLIKRQKTVDFSGLQTTGEVIARVRSELGDQHAKLLETALLVGNQD